MVNASLPRHLAGASGSRTSGISLDQHLSRMNVPPDVLSAVQHRPHASSRLKTSPMAHRAPADSFVLLQDSVYGSMPNTPTSVKRMQPSRNPSSVARSPPMNVNKLGTQGKPPAGSSGRASSSPTPQRPRLASNATTPVHRSSQSVDASEPSTPKSPTMKKIAAEAPPPPRASPHKLSAARLFSLLSSRTELDHPLCAECTHVLLESLHRQLEETKKERDGYIAFDRDVKRQKEAASAEGAGDEKEALRKIEQLRLSEVEAIKRLRSMEEEEGTLCEELAQLEREERALEEEEAEFWTAYSDASLTSTKLRDQLTSMEHAYAANSLELAKLSRTNVYNDAFCIGHDGVFGTINGLRLGRVPGITVEWSEINAAWGMTLLLLSTIARKVGYVFDSWRLVPMGSFSRIERINGDKSSYELYGSGDIALGRLFHDRRFDTAMVAFLDCLRQLMEYAQSQDPQVEFPQQVSKDKIGEASIRHQFGQEEAWTRALRHVLLALKLLLKWATNG
ncbi:autophagy protein 6 [Tulasnella sp. 331]|nr:autophagy protein 6 [Tulasnella sp. 331]KAG8888262.1 autophagy protein 6 [Tulasnella sp. 332]